MELFASAQGNDVFIYPIDPKLPASVQDQLRAERRGNHSLYVASIHLKIPHDVRPKELKGGIQRLEVTLSGRESLAVSHVVASG